LLLPVQRAAEKCGWLKAMVENGEVFYPLRWNPEEAFQLLQDLPLLESAGVIVRMPEHGEAPVHQGASHSQSRRDTAVRYRDQCAPGFQNGGLAGRETLSESEISNLLARSSGLHLVRGRWVEVDREKLAEVLDRFRAVERSAAAGGLTFAEAMRLTSGSDLGGSEAADEETQEWSRVVAGDWLAKTLQELRHPEALARVKADRSLKAKLRPYQQTGVQWLHLLTSLGWARASPTIWVWERRSRCSLFLQR